MKVLAIDIGGTRMKSAVIYESGEIAEKNMQATPKTYVQLLNTIQLLVEAHPEAVGLGISAPGILDQDTGIITGSSALSYWVGKRPLEDLSKDVHLPIHIENDGNSALLGERWLGAGQGQDDLAMLVIGSAVGGALMVDGQLLQGGHFNAGELGYMLVDNQPDMKHFGSIGGKIGFNSVLESAREIDPSVTDGESFFENMKSNQKLLNFYLQRLDFLCAGIVNLQYITDPKLIIIGGGISANPTFNEMLQMRLMQLREARPNYQVWPTVVMAKHQNDANLMGAANKFFYDESK